MGRKNRKRKEGFFRDNYWESDDYNYRAYIKNLDMLLSLAVNRFRWEGLPETCNARYLEKVLHRNGIATMAHEAGDASPVWVSLQAMPQGEYNMYGLPTRWRAVGYDGLTDFEVSQGDNGILCYYSFARVSPWNAMEIYARKLAHYERTEDVKVIDTGVDIIVEELARGYQQTLNSALMWLGIQHLAFEKGERMIVDEARANTAPTDIMLLDCLQARREFAAEANRLYGLDIQVYFNQDLESYNFNYTNNVEQMAQDKVILSSDGTIELGGGDGE